MDVYSPNGPAAEPPACVSNQPESVLAVVPSTAAQQEIWLSCAMGGVDATLAYNEAVCLTVSGRLDEQVMVEHLAFLALRHEAMRSCFSNDGQNLIVFDDVGVSVSVHDLTDMDVTSRTRFVEEIRQSAVMEPFDLGSAPLMRFTLLRTDREAWQLVISAHHAICDGWSFGVLIDELTAGIRDPYAIDPLSSPLAPRISDYALARHRQPAAQRSRAIKYWTDKLKGQAVTIALPVDHPRPAVRSLASARVDVLLDGSVSAGVRETAAALGVSRFAVWLAGFCRLMGDLSQQDAVLVAVPVAGQQALFDSNLIGHCINALPLLLPVPGGDGPAGISRVANELVEGLSYGQVSIGDVLPMMDLSREPDRLPMANVMFNIDQEMLGEAQGSNGPHFKYETIARRYEHFELFVNLTPVNDTFLVECQYSEALFDRQTVASWLDRFRLCVAAICAARG